MTPKNFNCKQCGNCCLNLSDSFQTRVPDDDVQMWKQESRWDILEWVDSIPMVENHYVHDIWISPVTRDNVVRCPWLRKLPNQDKYICRIHDVKPTHCRKYPKSRKHAEETGCRGFEY
jgi:Fe-S-cluster containining protein